MNTTNGTHVANKVAKARMSPVDQVDMIRCDFGGRGRVFRLMGAIWRNQKENEWGDTEDILLAL